MKNKLASLLWSFLLALICLSAGILLYKTQYPDRTLRHIAQSRLLWESENNSLISHFTFRNPKKAGVSEEITLPRYNRYQIEAALKKDKDHYDTLCKLDFSHSPDKQKKQALCQALCFFLKHQISLSSYFYFEEPFSPYGGVQCELPILLTEYSFLSKEDVNCYLEILSLLPDYLDGLCQFEQEKSEAGLFMSDESAQKVIDALDSFCELPDNTNPYLTTFQARVKKLYIDQKISKEEYIHYINENERLIKTVLFPAYEKTGDKLTLLKKGDKSKARGLCHSPGGKEYYETLVCSILGEDISIRALKNGFSRQLQEDYVELNALLKNNTDYFIDVVGNETKYDPLASLSAKESMELLQSYMEPDFGTVNPSDYPYEIKSVDKAMEAYTNPAYYFTPPEDDLKHNMIYINHSQTPKGLALFTTLAHEGFPGHLYQTVTSKRLLNNSNLPSLSAITHYGGFVEGYATYVEFLSYEYAKKAATKIALNEKSSLYYDYLMYQRRISLNLYSVLDIMIHYEGADENDIAPFLKRIGITKAEDIHAVYDYIANEPATYIKYYGGYLKILECKNLAKDVWGNDYSQQRFHKTLLELGPIDFLSLRNRIKFSPLSTRYF